MKFLLNISNKDDAGWPSPIYGTRALRAEQVTLQGKSRHRPTYIQIFQLNFLASLVYDDETRQPTLLKLHVKVQVTGYETQLKACMTVRARRKRFTLLGTSPRTS